MSLFSKIHDVLGIVVKVGKPAEAVVTAIDPPAGLILKAVIDGITIAESLFPDGEGDLKNKIATASVKRDAAAQGIEVDPAQVSALITALITQLNAQQKK